MTDTQAKRLGIGASVGMEFAHTVSIWDRDHMTRVRKLWVACRVKNGFLDYFFTFSEREARNAVQDKYPSRLYSIGLAGAVKRIL